MFWMWDVRDVGYWRCGMLGMWDVGDLGCWARSFPVRRLVDACVVRMSIFLSLNEDAALIR